MSVRSPSSAASTRSPPGAVTVIVTSVESALELVERPALEAQVQIAPHPASRRVAHVRADEAHVVRDVAELLAVVEVDRVEVHDRRLVETVDAARARVERRVGRSALGRRAVEQRIAVVEFPEVEIARRELEPGRARLLARRLLQRLGVARDQQREDHCRRRRSTKPASTTSPGATALWLVP